MAEPDDSLNAAEAWTREGRYEEALQKFLYYWEASRNASGHGGVRLSFALSSWKELAKVYPKAEAALLGIRDDHEKKLLAGSGDFDMLHEYASINREVNEESKTLALFKIIQKTHPKLAERAFFAIPEELLIAHHEYELASQHVRDIKDRLWMMRSTREHSLEKSREVPEKAGFFLYFADWYFENEARKLIEILVGAGRQSEAETVYKAVISILDSPLIRSALEDAEARVKAARQTK